MIRPQWLRKCSRWCKILAVLTGATLVWTSLVFSLSRTDSLDQPGLVVLLYVALGLGFSLMAWLQYVMVTLCIIRGVKMRIQPAPLSFLAAWLPLTLYFPLFLAMDFIVVRIRSGTDPTISWSRPLSSNWALNGSFLCFLIGLGCGVAYTVTYQPALAIACGLATVVGITDLILILNDATKQLLDILEELARSTTPPPKIGGFDIYDEPDWSKEPPSRAD